jgi:hypothetical protein
MDNYMWMTVPRRREEEALLVYLKVQSHNSWAGAKENREYLSHGSQDSNRLAPDNKSAAKVLGHMVWSRCKGIQ